MTKTRSKESKSKAGKKERSLALPRKTVAQKARAQKIYDALLKLYPDAHCELDYRSPAELLIATILSAQATDVGVNRATPALFKRFPTPQDFAAASPQHIEPYVKSLGFFRNKAKSVHGAMRMIVVDFGGKVPDTMNELLALPGVARKTASVVLGNAFGKNEGVVVDTHVIRLAQRFGLSKHSDPKKIELDLMALFPRETWTMLSHLLIWHGRRVCKARPSQAMCSSNPVCRQYCSNAKRSSSVSRKAALPRTSPRQSRQTR